VVAPPLAYAGGSVGVRERALGWAGQWSAAKSAARHGDALFGFTRERAIRWARQWSGPARAAAALAGLVVLLGFAAYGAATTVGQAGDTTKFGLPSPASDQHLIAALTQRGLTRFTSDYWTCYRLAFESGERLRCAVRDSQDGTLTRNGAVNRYVPYLLLIQRTAHPAYIFAAGSAGDATFDAWAAANGLPHVGYTRIVVEGNAIYYWPGGQG
jgi:hypothetical protein